MQSKSYSHFFSKNSSLYAIFNDQSFNDTLTNNIVNFKQLGPDYKEMFLKLTTNDQSDKIILLSSKFRCQGVVSPCPGTMYEIMRKMYKIRLQRFLFEPYSKGVTGGF